MIWWEYSLTRPGPGRAIWQSLRGDPVFLGAVLDFLMEDDARVIGFCDAAAALYGGDAGAGRAAGGRIAELDLIAFSVRTAGRVPAKYAARSAG